MGEWITKKGEAEPHKKGPAITKAGLKVEILNVCNCTSDSLHYEVKDPDGKTSFYQHPQLIPETPRII